MQRFRRLNHRLSYANVVATLALFISLGGASYAIVTLPAHSVGTIQLQAGAVTTSKLAFPLGFTSTMSRPTTLTASTIECVRAPCPQSYQVIASIPIVVKKPAYAYVEATGSFDVTEPGKETSIVVSVGYGSGAQPTIVNAASGGTPFTVTNTVKLTPGSQLLDLRAQQSGRPTTVLVRGVKMAVIVLPRL